MFVGLLAALLLAAGAQGAESRSATPGFGTRSFRSDTALMRRAVLTLSPRTRLLWHRLASLPTDKPQTIYWTSRVHDLDSDGSPELIVSRIRLVSDLPAAFGFTGTTHFDVLSGRTGARLWSRDDSFTDGYPSLPTGMRLGPRGAPGLLDIAIERISAGWTDTFTALSGDGQLLWTQSVRSTYAFAAGFVAANAPVAVERIMRAPDEATDLLIGLSEFGATGGETRMNLISGSDGSLSPYPVVEASAETVPLPFTAGNLDGHPGEDFVVSTNGPNDDGAIDAFSGIDGSSLWSSTVDLGNGADEVFPVRNVTSAQEADIVVGYLSSGNHYRYTVVRSADGEPQWGGKGFFPYVVGDIDHDGSRDLGTIGFHPFHNHRAGTRHFAYGRDGVIYSILHRTPKASCSAFCFNLGFFLRAGDLNADGYKDSYVAGSVGDTRYSYFVSGRTGRVMPHTHRSVALNASLNHHGDDLGRVSFPHAGVARLVTRDGATGKLLWASRLRLKEARATADGFEPYGGAADFSGDRVPDVAITLRGGGNLAVAVVDGRTGAILWSRAIRGKAVIH